MLMCQRILRSFYSRVVFGASRLLEKRREMFGVESIGRCRIDNVMHAPATPIIVVCTLAR
jgi:hypothetical protein